MACLVQVGAGSGGMAVLDLLGRDSRIDTILLIEPDTYKPHNVHRHYFPAESCGRPKADLAAGWLAERRPDLRVEALVADLCDPARAGRIDEMVSRADIGVCAVDNDRAKLHWDWLMRRHSKPWTLGEVLAGGIGGFVHMFVPGGPCFACVASQLQRETKVDDSPPPDYSAPGHAISEASIPASISSVHAIASLHALSTLALLGDEDGRGWDSTTRLVPLRAVPGIFNRALETVNLPFARLADCLNCSPGKGGGDLLEAFECLNRAAGS